jgi:hypothetical protein
MTPDDSQMDILMRRFAGRAAEARPGHGHLDPDEVSAFAEGVLPAATRARYVSHLADCEDCRKLTSQLTIASGRAAEISLPASETVRARTWWQRLGGLGTLPAWRYAVSALVILAVVGVAFVVWRRSAQPSESLVAQVQPSEDQQRAAERPAVAEPEVTRNISPSPSSGTVPQATPAPGASDKEATVTALSPAPPPVKAVPATEGETKSTIAGGVAPVAAEKAPGYAPQPPADYRMDDRARQQQSIAGATPGGPRRNESYDKYKVDRASSGDVAKQRDEDRSITANQNVAQNKPAEATDSPRPESTFGLSRRAEATKSGPRKAEPSGREETKDGQKKESDQIEHTRSAGGRKFQRQGAVWVDSNYKTSMKVKTIARGSDDFQKLDSGLRSIAQQLGGDIIVVWKGKGYRIR